MGCNNMDKDELEKIRQKKLAELQNQNVQEERENTIEAQKQAILRKILSIEAKQRLSNIKLVRPQIAESVELKLIQLFQQGAIKNKLNDQQLKQILRNIQGQKNETKIDIRRL